MSFSTTTTKSLLNDSSPTIPVVCFTFANYGRPITRRNISAVRYASLRRNQNFAFSD
ncbi:expressed protein [Arabidopsis lyrata subsp. lyrata]|uniref:Expressed protein n=1 Tax=Arabidopsis lyrata subsp. lyrata TaxID=81972 RepID=D7MDP4_ARALL|nr:expressed protein [Arabidopsis lyrata subsp. lyrata]